MQHDTRAGWLDRFASVLAGAALATYAVGLLTAHAYLDRIGVADFSQLRARFVVTGALVVVAIAGVFLTAYWAWSGRSTRLGRALLVVLPAAGVAGFFYLVSLDKGALIADRGFGWREFRFALILEVTALVAGTAALGLWKVYHGHWPPWVVAPVIFVGLAATVAFVNEFGRHAYPRIPVTYGGAEAICGTLIVEEKAREALTAAGLPEEALIANRVRRQKAVPIAYEGQDFYVLALRGDRWIRVRKELVQGVRIPDEAHSCVDR